VKSNSIAFISGHKAAVFTRNQSMARNILFSLLKKLEKGCLRIHEPDQLTSFGEAAEKTDLVADIRVLDPQMYVEVVFGGSIGSGEAYMNGYWMTPNLVQVIRVFVRN
jgi:cyclopropane-fatty-acyl-phospholipid synthase